MLGQLPSTDMATGLDFGTDGKLYELDLSGNIYMIDPSNASSTFVGSTGAADVLDLAIVASALAAVPEPSSILLLLVTGGIGLVAIHAGRSVPHSRPGCPRVHQLPGRRAPVSISKGSHRLCWRFKLEERT
jgi:hypothetical protein